MLEQNTPSTIDDETTDFAPREVACAEDCASPVKVRIERNSLPTGWMFIGAFKMPHSEHLIPFLL